MSLRRLIALYVAWIEKKVQLGLYSRGTADYYAYHHRRFQDHVGDVRVKKLAAWHLMTFSAAWHPIQAVQRLFSWAVDAGLVKASPFRTVKRPPLGGRKRIMGRAEEVRILRKANRQFRSLLLFLRESIARPQEARVVEWADQRALAGGHQYFQLDHFKGQNRRKDESAVRVIPLTDRGQRLIERLRRAAGPDPRGCVFLNTDGEPWTCNAVRIAMQSVRARLGMVPDRRGENVVAYTFRHTAATRAALAGLRDRILAELMGHASTRTTARYQHLDAAELLELFRQVMSRRRSPEVS